MSEMQDQSGQNLLSQAYLNELRQLLVGLSNEELKRLQTLLRDPHEFAGEISPLLPTAIRKLVERGQLGLDAVLPLIEDALHQGIQKNPKRLADILFPVMGPAIRKAVSEEIKRLIQAANAGLEHGFSPKRLVWRLQALFSGRSYTEILLSKTYIFHVSHVLLIHKQSGLLLHQEKAVKAISLEADLISAMLTAIRDFVSDSFQRIESASLDQIQVGELSILIEQGPFAILAAVISGTPPADYRTNLMETIEAVHFNLAYDLEHFDGDTETFQNTGKFLKSCLVSHQKTKKSNTPWPLLVVLVLVLGLLTYLGIRRLKQNRMVNKFVTELDAMPGYHLTEWKRTGRTYLIRGFKDFEAPTYRVLSSWKEADTSLILFMLDPIISLEPQMVLLRVDKTLAPEPTTFFDYTNGVLRIYGQASSQWVADKLTKWNNVAGIVAIDTSGLLITSQQTLDWIIPEIERYRFNFDVNITSLDSLQQMKFDSLIRTAVRLKDYNVLHGRKMAIFVQVYTSKSGNLEANLRKATERVEAFMNLLKKAGLSDELIEGRVLFTEETSTRPLARSVSFSVYDRANEK